MQIDAIQAALREQALDAWLFYDHHHRDPIAYSHSWAAGSAHVTRRWYYAIPAAGEPRKLVHRIESGRLDTLPGSKGVYSSWQELETGLDAMLAPYEKHRHAVFAAQRDHVCLDARCGDDGSAA